MTYPLQGHSELFVNRCKQQRVCCLYHSDDSLLACDNCLGLTQHLHLANLAEMMHKMHMKSIDEFYMKCKLFSVQNSRDIHTNISSS